MKRVFGFTDNERKTILPPFPFAVFVLSVILSAAYLGSGLSLALGIISASLSLIVAIAFTKSLIGTLTVVIPTGIVWLYTESFTLAALAAAAVTVIGLTSFLYKVTRSPFILTVIPASYLLAYAVCGSFSTALLSLVLFPAAAVASLSVSKDRPRISLICRTGITLFITALSVFAVWLAVSGRGISVNALSKVSDSVFSVLDGHFAEQYAELYNNYILNGRDPVAAALTRSDARAYAFTVFCALPAIFITLLNLISFSSSQLTLSLFSSGGLNEYLTPISLSFSMSWVSAAVFFLSYFAMLTSSGKNSELITAIAENIYLVLLPGLVFTGVLSLLGKGPRRKKHIFTLIAIAALFLYSPNLSFAVAAFIGCFTVTSAAMLRGFTKNADK